MSEDRQTELEELEKYKKKYEVTWLQEIKTTFVLTVGLLSLCGALFLALYFTRDLTMNRGTIKRHLNIFERSLSSETCSANLKKLTAKPHLAGTPEGAEVGEELAKDLKNLLGESAEVYSESYDVLLPFPTGKSFLNMKSSTTGEEIVANLGEKFVAPAAEKSNLKEASYTAWNQSFIAWSANKELSDDALVYVNYGTVEDFAKAEAAGVDFDGKVVIARYGKIFRGQKVKNAEDKKAAGVILYSDPQDDGATVGPTYPEGLWRPTTSFQRGSAMFLAQQPGDPTTPGNPSVPGTTRRIKREDAKNLPTIPVLAITADDAAKFMNTLTGDEVDAEWKGTLQGVETYRLGNAASTWVVNMKVENDEKITTIKNYFAKVTGDVEPDRQVMLGNHRDAWVYGATNPHSGTIVLLEVAKGLGTMLKYGWKPRRSIVFAFWDAEEAGLIGSVEFVEQYAQTLKNQLVAYVNVDNYQGDALRVLGSASLAQVARDAAAGVKDPSGLNGTALEFWQSKSTTGKDVLPTLVGSGSDYTGFYHHLGVPVLDLSFRQQNGKTYGAYHSIIDNYDYFSKFVDPEFKTCVSLSKLTGNVLLKLADDILLPLNVQEQTDAVNDLVDVLQESAEYKAAMASFTAAEAEKVNATMVILDRSAGALKLAGAVTQSHKKTLKGLDAQSLHYESRVRIFNDAVQYADRGFITPAGLPGRSWYKNVVSAPGKDDGYGFVVFPAVREALVATSDRADKVLAALSDLTDALDRAESTITGNLSSRNTQRA